MKVFAAILLFALIIGTTVSLHAQSLAPTVPGAVVGPTYYAAAYGVVANAGDQCLGTNLSNLIAQVNVTGGSIVFDAGTTLLSTCNFSAASGLALGPNVFLVGRGAAQSNLTTPATPPAVLRMIYAGTDVAHIECLTYNGQCGAVNLTVLDDTTSLPFFLYTGGIPYLNNVACWGRFDRTLGQQPDNDCVWFGNMTAIPPNYVCSFPSSRETDGFCGYGRTYVNVACHNIRRCLAFGSNANAIEAYAHGDFTDAYVDSSLVIKGGFVEFYADTGHPSYGNRVFINNEMATSQGSPSPGVCQFLGAFRMVQAATNNLVVYDASDPGIAGQTNRCDYTGYVEDTTSSNNYIIAQDGAGKLGQVSDPSPSGGNFIVDLVANRVLMRNGDFVHVGRTIPLNDVKMSIGYTIGMSNPLPTTGLGTIAWVTDSADGGCTNNGGGTGTIDVLCFYDGSVWRPMGYLSSPTFTSPVLGDATALSLKATGIVDGTMPVTKTVASSANLGGTYKSGYTFNQSQPNPNTAVTYTLPSGTVVAGQSYCIANSNNGTAATTGQLKLQTASPSTQVIIFTDGTPTTSTGYLQTSPGAAGDEICVASIDATHWQVIGTPRGSWGKH